MNNDLAALLLRVSLGIVFLAHGLAKIFTFTIPGTIAFVESAGFPGWIVHPMLAVELIGGLLVLLGVHARRVAIAFLPILAGAFLTHWPNGWMFSVPNGGWEFPAVMFVLVALLMLLHDGRFTLVKGTV